MDLDDIHTDLPSMSLDPQTATDESAQQQLMLDINRVSELKQDEFIRADEWELLAEDETHKLKSALQGTSWLDELNHQLGNTSESTVERVLARISNRARVQQNIQALLNFSTRSFFSKQHVDILEWAKKSYLVMPAIRINNIPAHGSSTAARKCAFTNQTPDTILLLRFRALNVDTTDIEESPPFYCSAPYDIIVKCWNLISRFESFVRRVVQSKYEALCDADKQNAINEEKLLQSSINHATRYLFIFFLDQRNKRPPCQCTLIPFHL